MSIAIVLQVSTSTVVIYVRSWRKTHLRRIWIRSPVRYANATTAQPTKVLAIRSRKRGRLRRGSRLVSWNPNGNTAPLSWRRSRNRARWRNRRWSRRGRRRKMREMRRGLPSCRQCGGRPSDLLWSRERLCLLWRLVRQRSWGLGIGVLILKRTRIDIRVRIWGRLRRNCDGISGGWSCWSRR